MNDSRKLQQLLDQIPALAGASISYAPGRGYFLHGGGDTPIWFETFEVAERCLKGWVTFSSHAASDHYQLETRVG